MEIGDARAMLEKAVEQTKYENVYLSRDRNNSVGFLVF